MHEIITTNINDLTCESSLLRQVSKDVDVSDIVQYSGLVKEMNRILLDSGHGTGISAIQIGIPIRLFIINMSRIDMPEVVAINPKVISITGRMTERLEGCLSLPNYHGKVRRRNKIQFSAYDLTGAMNTYQFAGYTAAVIQHEFDHLDGILYWDRMDDGDKPNTRG